MKNRHEEAVMRTITPHEIDDETKRAKNKIIDILTRFKAAYLSEIAWEAGISEYQARVALNILNDEDKIEIIPVHPFIPDVRLLARVADQSQLGQGGYINFSRKRWFGLKQVLA